MCEVHMLVSSTYQWQSLVWMNLIREKGGKVCEVHMQCLVFCSSSAEMDQ